MQTILTIIALLVVLGVVVFVHELGHFLAARWAGVRVDAFSIGFGPALVKWTDKRGTVWKIACLPLGGYVSIYGQEDMFNRKKYAELDAEKKRGHYLSAPAWKQFIIIGAGVFMIVDHLASYGKLYVPSVKVASSKNADLIFSSSGSNPC